MGTTARAIGTGTEALGRLLEAEQEARRVEGWAAFERACTRTRRVERQMRARGLRPVHEDSYRLRQAFHAQEAQPAADPMHALRRAASAVYRACMMDALAIDAWRVYLAARSSADRYDAALDFTWLARKRPALRAAWEAYQAAWRTASVSLPQPTRTARAA